MADRLVEYRRKRAAERTPEPVPVSGLSSDAAAPPAGAHPGDAGNAFVIQEHHARALHWDFRLQHDGVLVSWALPKGMPLDPKVNHLAVQTEDHPLEYVDFEGSIPVGEYGGGKVSVWDHGSYVIEKWTEREVKFVLSGERVSGHYVLIRTDGKNWLMHRMDPPPKQDWEPMPAALSPMLATAGDLPPLSEDDQWAYETKWDGMRALAFVDGGRVRLVSRNDLDVTTSFPELRGLGEQLGSTAVVLDGEIVAFAAGGRPSFARLQKRMHISRAAEARRLSASDPVTYILFDLLYLDGSLLTARDYRQRRAALESLNLAGSNWQTPPYFSGGGADLLRASREVGLEGIVAKRLTSTYRPGARSRNWRKIKNIRTQEVVIGGWKPGNGRRSTTLGSLLLGIPSSAASGKLTFVGKVGTGFTEPALESLLHQLRGLQRSKSPFDPEPSKQISVDAHWVVPSLVGEVAFTEWSNDGKLRHPVWRGLRPDKAVTDVGYEDG